MQKSHRTLIVFIIASISGIMWFWLRRRRRRRVYSAHVSRHLNISTVPIPLDKIPTRIAPDHPHVNAMLHKDFLTQDECDKCIHMAMSRWHRSTVESGVADVSRTSQSSFLQPHLLSTDENAVVDTIRARAASLASVPVSHIEQLQVVSYQGFQGQKTVQQFLFHQDGFTPDSTLWHDAQGHGGQRIKTIFVYLNTIDPQHGGRTLFKSLGVNNTPIGVPCTTGLAVMWHNTHPNTQELLSGAIHAGEPVIGPYTKYGLNIWIREHPLQ